MADSQAQSLEQAARFGYHFADIPVHPPGTQVSAPVQLKQMTGDHPVSSAEQHPNQTGLPDHLKAGIESLSGLAMDDVRVHYNSPKPAQLQALAYTQGTNIHVAPGQEQHLSHEAWHVVQQAQGRVRPTMQLKDGVPVNDDQALEHEADVMGANAMRKIANDHRALQEQAWLQGRFGPKQSTARAQSGSLHVSYGPQQKRRSLEVTGQRERSELDGGFAGELEAHSTASMEITRTPADHGSRCGCVSCRLAAGSNPASAGRDTSIPSWLTQVIQGKWKCDNCGAVGEGKPSERCNECGKRGTQKEVVEGKLPFGTWWQGLGPDRRQALLRQHGSHEKAGGAQQKDKGGGPKKGDQHDTGQANAEKQIRKKYEAGEYD